MDRFLAKLYSRINYERQARVEPQHFKLNNLRALLARIGNPEAACPVIHVAGTKGKGSVATMVANVISETGRKTGLFTSPHLIRINQRIAIDGQPISNDDFESILNQLAPEIEQMDEICESIREPNNANSQLAKTTAKNSDSPEDSAPEDDWTHIDPKSNLPITGKPLTFFEVMTAAAFLYYANQNCDAVVLEVGLGGRLDSTNVCQPSACVITNISLDHTRQLGSTIDKIAFEKAGIIKPGVPVVSGELKPLAANVIAQVAQQRSADLILLNRDFSFSEQTNSDPDATTGQTLLSFKSDIQLTHAQSPPAQNAQVPRVKTTLSDVPISMLGSHQRSNASLAIATAQVLNCQGWNIGEQSIRKGLLKTELPGRTQIVQREPTVALDVAHNVASAEVLLTTLKAEVPAWNNAAKKRLIISISKDKDCQSILDVLVPEFDQVVFTKYQENPRAIAPSRLLAIATSIKEAQGLHSLELSTVELPSEAWLNVDKQSASDDFVCITGSVFLIAEMAESFQAENLMHDQS